MARAVGILFYALLTGASILLLITTTLFSSIIPAPPEAGSHHRPHRRLGYLLRSRRQMHQFDPLLEKMQQMSGEEARLLVSKDGMSSSSSSSMLYFGEEGKLNISKRLEELFPAVDRTPADGKVSFQELEDWSLAQAVHRLAYRTHKELFTYDRDRDGAVTFQEFLPQFSALDIAKNETGHGQAGWWMELFRTADVNGNGNLDFYEFNNFLHPEDSHNRHIQIWLLKGNMKRMDDDGDERLDFAEFLKNVYGVYKTYVEFEKIQVPTAEEKFAQLDINHDKLLTVEELLPLLPYLKPGELTYAKIYAHYLIGAADDDGDEHLTLQEMLNHESIFYTTIYDSVYENDDDYHDEL